VSHVINCHDCGTIVAGEYAMEAPNKGDFYTFYCKCGSTFDYFFPLRDE